MDVFRKSNEPVIIKDTNFKRCKILISFPFECDDDDLVRALKAILFDKSAKYDTDKKMHEVTVNNYCSSYDLKIPKLGKTRFLELYLTYPCVDSLHIDVLEDNLKFIKELIYNPYLEDGTFSKKDIDERRNILKNRLRQNFKDGFWYYDYKNDTTIDEDNFLVSKYIEDMSLIDKINSNDMYNLYKSIISNCPLVFLIGNVDVDKAKESINRIIYDNKKEEIVFDKKYDVYAKDIPSTPFVIEEHTKFKTTSVYYNYKVKDMNSRRDEILLKIVKNMLSSDVSKLLFDELRINNDLVYKGYSYFYNFGTLSLCAFTDKENISTVEEVFKGVMKKITDTKFIHEKLELLKEKAKLNIELEKENITDILMKQVDEYIGYRDKYFYEWLCEIDDNEVKDFINNRLIYVGKYIGVGDGDE